jgi:hypothetical protein
MANITRSKWLVDATLRLLRERIHSIVTGRELRPVASAAWLGYEREAREQHYTFHVPFI